MAKKGLTLWSHENDVMKIWVGRSQVQNLALARTLCCGIFVKMYSSSCDLHTKYQFNVKCIGWPKVCFTCERCDIRSINIRSTRQVATFKKIYLGLIIANFLNFVLVTCFKSIRKNFSNFLWSQNDVTKQFATESKQPQIEFFLLSWMRSTEIENLCHDVSLSSWVVKAGEFLN